MSADTVTKAVKNPEAFARERFVENTAEHVMEILRDDGLYRHVRFRKPGTVMYSYDLVTWPGYLAVVGDCASFLFARTADMFDFFAADIDLEKPESWHINPRYWSEKVQAPTQDGVLQYSYETFVRLVNEWFDGVADQLDPAEAASLRATVDSQLLAEDIDGPFLQTDERAAHDTLNRFEHDGRRIHDAWEWDLREYRHDFLWACWAIVSGIAQYKAAP